MRSSTTVTWLRLRLHRDAHALAACPPGTLTLRNVRAGSALPASTARRPARRRPRPGRNRRLPRRALERHGDARNAQQRPLQRARHGARIRHIVAEVVALVDAGHDEVGRRARSMLRDGDVDAVGRRAVDLVDAVARAARTRSGRRSVSAWPIALASICGATTVTSPRRATARASAWMPSDRTPSSLVTRIRFMMQGDWFDPRENTSITARSRRGRSRRR